MALKLLLIYFVLFLNSVWMKMCKLYEYDYRGLIVMVVVGWLDKNLVELWIN